MKTKTLLSGALFFAVVTANAQITTPTTIVTPTSVTVPDSIPNYNGTYDNIGQGELYYPNGGEVRYADRNQSNAIDFVKFYTMNTYPKRYLLKNNNISLCYSKCDAAATASGIPDTLHRIDLEWRGSNGSASLAKVDEQNFGMLNYFTQWFTASGRTGVKGSAAIASQSIYNNIDLVYTSNNSGLVMYLIVYPGGNYKDIIMHVNGSKANSIVGGKLKLEANWDYTTLEAPKMYQYTMSGNVVTPVNVCNASWQSIGGDSYQIYNATSYNTSMPLIIQLKQANALTVHTPGLLWSTYFGGSQYEWLNRTHSDASNNLYTAGYSQSANFPQGPGLSVNVPQAGDAAIVKFNAAGQIQWSTFVGGAGNDEFYDFDFSGNSIFCVGHTSSHNLVTLAKNGNSATVNGTFGGPNWDGFICELGFSNTGQIQNNWLTYFGGNGDEELNACKFDSQGNLFVVGASASANMTPMGPSGSRQVNYNPAQLSSSTPLSTDGIIAKFNTSGIQTWLTFYGTDALGTNAHTYAADYFYGLTINGTDVYVCGKAGGSNLPNSINSKLNNGNFDGILTHFTTSGVMSAGDAKFTNGNITNYAVKVLLNNVYVVGQANSAMTPVNSGSYYYNGTASGTTDGCVSMHSLDLSTTIHNTFLGGDHDDAAYDIQFNSNNLFYVTGGTNSTNFPTFSLSGPFNSPGGPDPTTGIWTSDNFISCFQIGNTSLTWSAYLGSKDFHESSVFPNGLDFQQQRAITTIAVDALNRLHLVGYTNSYNTFPPDDGAGVPYFQGHKSGGVANDATITRFDVASINTIVGIKDFENTEFVFGLYPNPTSKYLSITNKAIANDDLRYAVYDLSGKKLKEGKLKASDVKDIDVSELSQGVYVINVSNGKMTYSNKFVKIDN